MITSDDINKKTFNRQIQGYSVKEVEEFLLEIMETIDTLSKENALAKEQISVLTDTIKQYKVMEDSMQNTTPVQIEKTAEPDNKQAEEKAEELAKLAYKYEQMRRSVEVFRAKVVSLLNSQLGVIKEYSDILVDDDTLEEAKKVYQEMLEGTEKKMVDGYDIEDTARVPRVEEN